jgi:hypothetical protein
MRIQIQERPFNDNSQNRSWGKVGVWPASWVSRLPVHDNQPCVEFFKLNFKLENPQTIRFHVSADQRYELYFDGQWIGRGSERGDRLNWFFETYEVSLEAGDHQFFVQTWWLGSAPAAPYAQMSVRPAFLLAAEGISQELISTGLAPWQVLKIDGIEWLPYDQAWGTGHRIKIDGNQYPWDAAWSEDHDWLLVTPVGKAFDDRGNDADRIWHLRPALLPPMLNEPTYVGTAAFVEEVDSDDLRHRPVEFSRNLFNEAETWTRTLQGDATIEIAPFSKRRIIIDLGNYYCGYLTWHLIGGMGSRVRVHWAESLYSRYPEKGQWIASMPKENRDEIENRYFWGVGSEFVLSGSDGEFKTLWWEAGRFVEVYIETNAEALKVSEVKLLSTHYPYNFVDEFEASDNRLESVVPLMRRALEMCSHETYMDCPYYEQLMYVGDTRLEVLTTYTSTPDDRLPKKAIEMFDQSRIPSGLTFSRYPSDVTQFIPPFSLWWIAMVHDHMQWRDDPDFIRKKMPGVRAVLDFFRLYVSQDDLLVAPTGWNYFDWIGELSTVPAGTVHGLYNWIFVYCLNKAAELEESIGEPELASRNRKLATRIGNATMSAFWNAERNLFADDLDQNLFSEHSQCLALLSGFDLGPISSEISDGLLRQENLTQTTIYFSHYLFEVLGLLGEIDTLIKRMDLWFALKENGLKTTIEHPEPTRSDCHAWGAHPLYHYYATICGVRPGSIGFRTVKIEPKLGSLEWVHGKVAHPLGVIEVHVRKDHAIVTLPDRLVGDFVSGQTWTPLLPGTQSISL